MSLISCPTNVRVPTHLDGVVDRYVAGTVNLVEFLTLVDDLFDSGKHDEPLSPFTAGLPLDRVWQ